MRLLVFVQVITAHEALAARVALEALLAGVRADVTLQLVGAREALAAEQPVTDERALASVPAQVRLQVRRLVVDLAAARYVTRVDAALARAADWSETVEFLTVRAVARAPARVASRRARVRQEAHARVKQRARQRS